MDPDGAVLFSSVPWKYLRIAPQQTALALSRMGLKVLFVERPTSVSGLAIEPGKTLADFRRTLKNAEEVSAGLYILNPCLATPFWMKNIFSVRATTLMIGRAARKAQRKIGLRNPAAWHYLPQGVFLKARFGESRFVYEVIDEHSAFPGVNVRMFRHLDRQAVKAADIVFAISENLHRNRITSNPNTHLCPIGCEADFFQSVAKGEKVPDVLNSMPRPIVGYAGNINERMDFSVCEEIAGKMPDVCFAYIGPVGRPELTRKLRTYPNVYMIGPVEYERLPEYLCNMDVLILPYAMSRFNDNIFPNKIFEYVATGAPVVSTPVPSIRYLGEKRIVAIADRAPAFIAALRAALESGRQGAEIRTAYARENTWQKRTERMWAQVLGTHAEGQP